ncbi:unnamed protein product [Euphydryas editha]|uniref:Uncharacterized protein n=1 Tax=Euphydryas editha TaxID=104508 RepID=A0AAU9TXM5_EUPED|nr:unnamed protein product [Euphydryas editha]
MGFASTEEKNKAKDRLTKDGTGLVVEDIKNRNPLLVLTGVMSVNTDEYIVKALRNQNRDLFGAFILMDMSAPSYPNSYDFYETRKGSLMVYNHINTDFAASDKGSAAAKSVVNMVLQRLG